MKTNITAVAFDIDGTLYKSWPFYIKILPFLLKNFKKLIAFNKTRKEIRSWQVKNPNTTNENFFDFQAEIFSKFYDETPNELKTYLEQEIYLGWKEKFKEVKPYPHSKETIEILKNKNLKIAVLSDFVPEQKNDIWGILPLCDMALGSEYIGALKPSKLVFEHLAKCLGVPPEEVLYVGNNFKYDILGAKQVGMHTAYIVSPISLFFHKLFKTKTFQKTDICFSNYKQLLIDLKNFIEENETINN